MKKRMLSGLVIFVLFFNCFAEPMESVLRNVHAYLSQLKDSSSGAIDANGKFLKDSNNGLNCSGFAKWIVDGFYTPLCKEDEHKYISIQVLKNKHPEERGAINVLIYEERRDPYFGLDWTRNLAVELGKKRGGHPSYKTYDVTDSAICEYIPNCGYPILKIEEVITEQAKLHPEKLYLGSINGYYGENPKLWQHYHIAVFIPYYAGGELKIAVLERNKETSFEYLLKRYPNTYCHLVEISTEGEFQLMEP